MRSLLASVVLLAACGDTAADRTEQAGQMAVDNPEAPAAPSLDASRSAEARPVACIVPEEEIFGCRVASGKRIAVCATDDGGGQYRFGGERPELVLEGGEWASTPYSGGGEAQIAFTSDAARYVVFSRMVRTNFTAGEPNDPVFSDGVIVLDGENVIGLQVCSDPDVVPIQYSAAEAHFPRAEELFTWETDRADANYPAE